MKVSLRWLRELVDGKIDADTLADKLTMAGFEIEGRAPFAPISGVVVARVVAKRPHPEANKLSLVDVEVGDGKPATQVVCGAANVPAPGGLVLWARPGATLPGGITLGEKPVRGILSPGMLCAEDELGLGTSHEGILILDEADGLAPGDDFARKLGLPDEIWEVNVTPNRPDGLGHVGIAREAAALLGLPLKLPKLPAPKLSGAPAKVELVDADGCPRYAALVVDGITVRPSPIGVRLRLAALGVRPISNVVDATNLTMLLWSQPLHAFDLDRLAGGGVVIRAARAGETLVTLDGQTRTLEGSDLVIADDNGAVAVAGVMGGAGSEVSAKTTRLFIESAHFSPARVRRTAKRLGLHTEAAHRFERGTDPGAPANVCLRLAQLIVELSGGKLGGTLADVHPQPIAPTSLTLRAARTTEILGLALPIAEQARLLGSLGIVAKLDGETLRATIPTWRPDLTREIDLIEEIARLHGYERIVATLPLLRQPPGPMRGDAEVVNDTARDALRGLGLDEVITYGFVGPKQLAAIDPEVFLTEGGPVRVVNPLREDQAVMRTTLVPSLCLTLQRNLVRGNSDVQIFEVGATFVARADAELPDERWHVAGLLHGRSDGWLKPGALVDFFDAKGVCEELLAALGHTATYAPSAEAWLHPGQQAGLHVGGAIVGHVGRLHPQTARALDVEAQPLVFEIDLAALPAAAVVTAHELPRFPPVSRDLSFFIDEGVAAARIRESIERARNPLLIDVRVLEDYREPGKVPVGKKGMLWSFTYRAPDRTLTDAEVQTLHDGLVAQLAESLSFDRR
jgi:phenylalanyl-tRNA synthetase beta chain